MVRFDWTGDSLDGSVPVTAAKLGSLERERGRHISMVEVVPNVPAPSNGYAVRLLDAAGEDLMGGAISQLSSSGSEVVQAPPTTRPFEATFSLSIAGQAVADARGTVLVYFGPTGISNPPQDAHPPTSSNRAAAGAFDTSEFDFPSQVPGGTLEAGIIAEVTLTPCPRGVNGSDAFHPLYVTGGTGSAEAVTITGGTCLSGAASGTVEFIPANDHSGAWRIRSATSGIRECFLFAGPGKACFTPAGNWDIYATLYDDQLVNWSGTGISSAVEQEFNGDGIIIGPGEYAGNRVSVRDLSANYAKDGDGVFAASGALWTFRNVSDGLVGNLYSFLGYEGFKFEGSTGVEYFNLETHAQQYGFHWTSASPGNAGAFTNLSADMHGGNHGASFFIEPTIEGLSLTNINSAEGDYGIVIRPGDANPVNELVINGGFVDSADISALLLTYVEHPAEAPSNSIHISNVRFTTSDQAISSPVAELHNYRGIVFSNDAFYSNANAAGADGVVVRGMAASSFIGCSFDVSNAEAAPLRILADAGGEINRDLIFSGDRFGMNGVAAPREAVVTDSASHDGIRFTGNKINPSSGIAGFAKTVDTFFDRTNDGLPMATVASSPALVFPPVPDVTLTGRTTVTSVGGLAKGASGFVVAAEGNVTFLAGPSIGRTCKVTKNRVYMWWFDGAKVWLTGHGC